MCCNTVPAPCASVRNQRASVKLPLSPSETLENPAYSANITTGAVSLSLSLSVMSISSRWNNPCILRRFLCLNVPHYDHKGSETDELYRLFRLIKKALSFSQMNPTDQNNPNIYGMFINCKNRLWLSFPIILPTYLLFSNFLFLLEYSITKNRWIIFIFHINLCVVFKALFVHLSYLFICLFSLLHTHSYAGTYIILSLCVFIYRLYTVYIDRLKFLILHVLKLLWVAAIIPRC